MNRTRIATLLLTFSSMTGWAEASFDPNLIYDQRLPFADQALNIAAFSPIGETFTPRLGGIEFAAIGFSNFAPHPQGGLYDVALYQGVGVGGTLLGTTNPTFLPPGFGEQGLGEVANFFFGRRIPLTPDAPYTLIVEKVSGDDFGIDAANIGQTGNHAILHGTVNANLNLAFGEGLVPEPPGVVLAGTACLIGVVAWCCRRSPDRVSLA